MLIDYLTNLNVFVFIGLICSFIVIDFNSIRIRSSKIKNSAIY